MYQHIALNVVMTFVITLLTLSAKRDSWSSYGVFHKKTIVHVNHWRDRLLAEEIISLFANVVICIRYIIKSKVDLV